MHTQGSVTVIWLVRTQPRAPAATNDGGPIVKNSFAVFHDSLSVLCKPEFSTPHHIELRHFHFCPLLPASPASERDQHAASGGATQAHREKFKSLSNKVFAYQLP